jgi:hypothetical protein
MQAWLISGCVFADNTCKRRYWPKAFEVLGQMQRRPLFDGLRKLLAPAKRDSSLGRRLVKKGPELRRGAGPFSLR